jgi:hypothetical protein
MLTDNPIRHRCRATGVYNSRNPTMVSPLARWVGLVLALCIFPQAGFGADWHQLTDPLAPKITAITGPGVVALEIENRSSIGPADVEQIRSELKSALSSAGIKIWQPDQSSANIRITLSENLQNYVWVAEIQQAAEERSLLIVSAPRPASSIGGQNVRPLTLQATRLISRPEPILDVAAIESSPRRLLVLGTDSVAIYEFTGNRWNQGQSVAIAHDKTMPRDPRGRIFLRKDRLFDVYLPGVGCRSGNAWPLTMNCTASDDPWPLQSAAEGALDSGLSAFFSPSRNFFTGALVPGIGKQKSAPPFYSAAPVPREKYVLWLFAGIDGQLHILDGINSQNAPKIQWGSEMASVHTACRSGWQVLTTSSGDSGQDTIQAFEFPDREPVEVSQKIELPGDLTALWTGQNGESAAGVVRNNETGNYEAMLFNLSCN